MITLSENACQAVHALTADAPADAGVRIAGEPSVVDGQSASVMFTVVKTPEPEDLVIEESGARVFVQPSAAKLLGDQTLDARVDRAAEQVRFFLR